jgi:hypothetical protein
MSKKLLRGEQVKVQEMKFLKSKHQPCQDLDYCLKENGNEADFLGFLHKPVRHRSLTIRFEPLRFWLRIRGDIRNQKTTPRLAESWYLLSSHANRKPHLEARSTQVPTRNKENF